MKSTFASLAAMLSIATSAVAQYNVSSAPFYLSLRSDNATLNGTVLQACHEGAAIEGLCVTKTYPATADAYETYTFNTSSYNVTYDPALGEPGYLVWTLQSSTFNISSPMFLAPNFASNVANALLEPIASPTFVAFDECDKLNLQVYIDDTVTPPKAGPEKAYYRWYVCVQNDSGYVYNSLAWVFGAEEPQNPSCQKVDVVREFL